MILGVLSDTHDNVENTRRALDIMRQNNVEFIIHCGDVTTPEVVAQFEGWHTAFVYGNMDYDIRELARAVYKLENTSINDSFTAELAGKTVAASHGDNSFLMSSHTQGGRFDYVFHGHTHAKRDDRIGRTRIINPGALQDPANGICSVCVIDLEKDDVRFINLP